MALYVDTSAWIALKEPKDKHHQDARSRYEALARQGELLVTGWHTLIEFADGLARHYDQKTAHREIGRLLASPRLRVESSESHLAGALEIFRDRHDWNVDFSDCLSFALMKDVGVERAFSYDHDFEKAGFRREG